MIPSIPAPLVQSEPLTGYSTCSRSHTGILHPHSSAAAIMSAPGSSTPQKETDQPSKIFRGFVSFFSAGSIFLVFTFA
ncbi:uncharacterized protein N7483_000704 [Penicillium malachiteum]|uniref:uncharacterized protein n=1 Tax=Penicillium malachiteum TaxID=1324776 RepID=UPI0025472AFA|nr:uncharacterized protein N7483_000704 [Penicillium malachiteum]KAJ5735579.1 hypothetical protein N7483_000704 [Penicillium malachiteum]